MDDPLVRLRDSILGSALAARHAITVAPGGGAAVTVEALYSAVSEDELGMIQQRPMIRGRASDLAGLGDGDAVTVNGAAFVAREIRPDGRGMADVILEAA